MLPLRALTARWAGAGLALSLIHISPRRSYGPAIAGFVLPVVLAILWEWLVAAGIANGRLMPPPGVVGRTLGGLAASGELLTHAGATLWRVAAGSVSYTHLDVYKRQVQHLGERQGRLGGRRGHESSVPAGVVSRNMRSGQVRGEI